LIHFYKRKMAVEKKAPGINLETSEVFETSSLCEADQHYFNTEESSDSIKTIHITTSQAFGRFKGTFVDNSIVDFSDTIRNSRRKGYIVWKGNEENGEEETPFKKYQRLNCEIRELLEEVKEAQGKNGAVAETGSLEALSAQVDLLHKHLLEMRLDDVLGKQTEELMTNPQAAYRQKLLTELNEIKSMKVGDRSSDTNNTQATNKVNYSLMLKPDTSRLQAQASLHHLTSRITALENVLGDNDEDLSILSMETGKKTLSEAASLLSAKTTILQPKNLDHIEGRLAVLQQKLNSEEERPPPEGEEEEQHQRNLDKVRHLANISGKSEEWAHEIPDLIDRMEALSPLHEQAAEISESILQLETVQKQLLLQTSNNFSLLKEIEKKFETNLSSIEKNFDSLQTRIDAVKAKK